MATTRIWVAHWHWYSSSAVYAATLINVLPDTRRLITSNRMTHQNRRHTWCTTTWTICTDGRCVNPCHTPNFDESKTRTRQRDLSGFAHLIFSLYSGISAVSIRHTNVPFCPTRNKPAGKREDKLLATLYDKQRYVILPQSAIMYLSLCNKNSSYNSLNLHGSVITLNLIHNFKRARKKMISKKIYIN